MKREFKRQIVDLLDEHRIMTVATNRPDGWPQATVVGYANDGLIIYCFIARDGQKYANIMRDPRISLATAKDYPQPLQIKGLSIAAKAVVVEDQGEIEHAGSILLRRYPEYKDHAAARPGRRSHAADHAGDRFDPRLFQRLRP
jgi:nitroimidazol reductase NimA-like FMN-containing flavoprotein (pyridoxamine 5'-phosphate oxidase superfamily)